MPPTETRSPTGGVPKHRYACPAGHKSWERVNNHAWCHACSQERHVDAEVDPEWHELVDTRTGERVPYDELRREWPAFSEVDAY